MVTSSRLKVEISERAGRALSLKLTNKLPPNWNSPYIFYNLPLLAFLNNFGWLIDREFKLGIIKGLQFGGKGK